METEIYESDPFTAKRQDLLVRRTSEYRFEKGDELYLHQGGDRPLKVRLIDVRVHVQSDGRLTREILVLKV